MRIAVVIPAYNEAGNIGPLIEETIAAVRAATLGEVIVVDDSSDDGTDAYTLASPKSLKGMAFRRTQRRCARDVSPSCAVIKSDHDH